MPMPFGVVLCSNVCVYVYLCVFRMENVETGNVIYGKIVLSFYEAVKSVVLVPWMALLLFQ